MRIRSFLMLLLAAPAAFAAPTNADLQAQARKGPLARVQSTYLAPGWHEGYLGKSQAGCVMFYLNEKMPQDQNMLSLRGMGKLEQKRAAGWTGVPLAPLAAGEPKACRGDGLGSDDNG